MKTIGVLTSGGDSQGMNAVIRAVVRAGKSKGMNVMGIHYGYQGLIDGNITELNENSVSDIISRGGTVLKTARCLEFKDEPGVLKGVETCHKFGIEGIVVVGGDGSFRGARDLCLHGIKCVAIPGTIDNDIVCTDYTIGYDTCLNIVIDAIDRLKDTCESHNRCSVVQVMGKYAGWVALESGLMTDASAILVPEIEFDFQEDVVKRIKRGLSLGKESFIVVAAEGIFENVKGNKNYDKLVAEDIDTAKKMARAIERETGVESREAILAHIQRGGSPTARDRIVATEMGYYAVNLLEKDIYNRVVRIENGKVSDIDILEGLNMKKPLDIEKYNMAKEINL